jgi:hypothetical protein
MSGRPFMSLLRLGILAVLGVAAVSIAEMSVGAVRLQGTSDRAGDQAPAFEFFKTRVEPIFIKKRGDHARCYACHSQNNSAFHLQRLLPGRTSWTEAQSRLNIESVSKLIVPGNPTSSRLLTHPLAPEGGGESFHSGGRQFASKDDPDWRTIAEWVRMAAGGHE